MQAHLDRYLRIDPRLADGPVLNPWLGAHDPVISPVGLRVHPAGSLETQDEWARPHLHRRCSSGSRARCFTVSIGAMKASTCAYLALTPPRMLLSSQACPCPVEYINNLLI
jgi:hypothetical protein